MHNNTNNKLNTKRTNLRSHMRTTLYTRYTVQNTAVPTIFVLKRLKLRHPEADFQQIYTSSREDQPLCSVHHFPMMHGDLLETARQKKCMAQTSQWSWVFVRYKIQTQRQCKPRIALGKWTIIENTAGAYATNSQYTDATVLYYKHRTHFRL